MKSWLMILGSLVVFVLPARAADIQLDNVQFKSQSPPGDWSQNMNCGPASALMLAGYYLDFAPTEDGLKAVIDWLYENNYLSPQPGADYYDGNATTMALLSNVLAGYFKLGPLVKQNKNDLDLLADKLSKGNPIIVAVNIQMDPQKQGHFMLLVGLNETEVIVHDPGKTLGEYNYYSHNQFLASWQTSNYASLFVDTSPVSWHPDGSLIQVAGDAKIYVLIDGKAHWIINEAVFNAHNFDWQKVIQISESEFECYSYGGEINWQPYRELFKVGEIYYLMEKQSLGSSGGSVYQFSSAVSFNSWNIQGMVKQLNVSEAEVKYFSKYASGGLLYVRHGTLVKPTFSVPGYGPGAVFVAVHNGELLPFENWNLFCEMGYDQLPVTLVGQDQFYASLQNIGSLITTEQSQQCLNPSNEYGQGWQGFQLTIDNDGDGISADAGDCDDSDQNVFPGQMEICDGVDNNCDGQIDEGVKNVCGQCGAVPIEICDGVDNDCDGQVDEGVKNACGQCGSVPFEVCDAVDNDCDGQIDEGELCPSGKLCFAGACVAIQIEPEDDPTPDPAPDPEYEPEPENEPEPEFVPEPIDEPEGDEEPEKSDSVNCTVICPSDMKAFVWYGASGQASGGGAASFSSTIGEICERGAAWIDFNCACKYPNEWACFDPAEAVIQCDHEFETKIPGLIDSAGEGEVWFTDFECFPE